MKEHYIDYRGHRLHVAEHGDRRDGNTVLLQHGAAGGCALRLEGMGARMAAAGYHVLVPDMIGHGKTGGDMAESSLRIRHEAMMRVLSAFDVAAARAIVGFSMGGQTAADVLRAGFAVRDLVLAVPGIYDEAAWDLPFGPAFTASIRRDQSWHDTRVTALLGDFTGGLLVVSAENDKVIPKGIPLLLLSAARRAERCAHIELRGSGHSLASKMVKDPAFCDGFTAMIVGWLAQQDALETMKRCGPWETP